jgi:hypothetical protein
MTVVNRYFEDILRSILSIRVAGKRLGNILNSRPRRESFSLTVVHARRRPEDMFKDITS